MIILLSPIYAYASAKIIGQRDMGLAMSRHLKVLVLAVPRVCIYDYPEEFSGLSQAGLRSRCSADSFSSAALAYPANSLKARPLVNDIHSQRNNTGEPVIRPSSITDLSLNCQKHASEGSRSTSPVAGTRWGPTVWH